MKDESEPIITRRFDRQGARQYEHRIRAVVPGYEALHEMVRSLLQHHLGETGHLLVVGSGTGTEIAYLGEGSAGWRFTGVDPSADMVSVSRRRVAERGLSERVELHTGFVHELPTSTLYNAATSILVMHFIPDDGRKLDFLRSVSARLELGAPFILADMHGDKTSGRFTSFIAAWKLR